jgi:hypothetical protein
VGGTCGTNGEEDEVCRLFIGKPEGKRPLGRRRRDIKMANLEIVLSVVD